MKRRGFLKVSLPLAMTAAARAEDAGTPELSFGVIADPQYADQDSKGSRYYRESLGKLKKAIEILNTEKPKFVVTLGDVIDDDFKSFTEIMPLYEALEAPHHIVPGNHDFSVADADKEKVMAALKRSEPYFSEVHGTWRFIYLDGTEVATWRYPEGDARSLEAQAMLKKLTAENAPQAKEWNAAIGAKQLDWLRLELDSAKVAGQQAIVFNHYPVMPAGLPLNLWNAGELVELLESRDCVAAYMNGHHHAGNYAEHGGCHYLNFKGMVETKGDTAFAMVHCYADRLEVEGYGLEIDRELD